MKIKNRLFESPDMREVSMVLDKIIALVRPERVFCLGVRVNRYEEWSVFKSPDPSLPNVTIDFMIVIRTDDKRRIDEINEVLAPCNSPTLLLNTMVHRASYVRRAVERGSYFFSKVCRDGELLYEAEGIEKLFIPPWNHVNVSESLLRMERRWYSWFDMARRSFSEARNCIGRKEYVVGVCLLQQAAEYTCVAVVRMATGYRPPARNLRQLLELATGVSLGMAIVFPGITKQEEALLDTLQNAMAYARFKEGYTVPGETALILADRVADLQQTALQIYSRRMGEKAAALVKPEEDMPDAEAEPDLYRNPEKI